MNDQWTSARVRGLMEALGLTLDEFAARCNVARRTVQGWMIPEVSAGHRKPRGPTVILLNELEHQAKHAATK